MRNPKPLSDIYNAMGTNNALLHRSDKTYEFAVKGLNGSNRMVLSTSSNLYVGVDMLNDAEEFKIFYSQDNDEVRFISKFKLGAQVAFGAFVVDFQL